MTLVQILTLVGIPSVCATLITTGIHHWIENHRKKKGVKSSEVLVLQALARVHLREMYNTQKQLGYTTYDDFEDFKALYEGYHAIGGNGAMTQLFEQYKLLEIKEV